MARLLIVGAGLTGASIAHLLKSSPTVWSSVSVFDKARAPGGRNTTSEFTIQNAQASVDLGAQYFSLTPADQVKHKFIYEDLLKQGILQPLLGTIDNMPAYAEGTEHLVASQGGSSIVRHWLKGVHTKYSCRVLAVNNVDNSHWEVSYRLNGQSLQEKFDAVVITFPVPQLFQLEGNIQSILDKHPEKEHLQRIQYSSRFAFGLFYPSNAMPSPRGDNVVAQYVSDNPCIRYVAWDTQKRGQMSPSPFSSLCVHTSVPFTLQHLQEPASAVQATVLKELATVLNTAQLPTPVHIKAHKWRFSQVHKNYPVNALELSGTPLLLLAGDAFTRSGINGCLDSASDALQKLLHAKSKHQSTTTQ